MGLPASASGRLAAFASLVGFVILASCTDATTPKPIVTPPGDTAVTPKLVEQAFIYTPGEGMSPIPALPGATLSEALAMNDAGEVVGINKFGNATHAFFWSKATGTIDLGRLPGAGAVLFGAGASGINASGQVVGWSDAADGYVHAFRWTLDSGLRDLGTPGRGIHSFGYAINSAGDVAGAVFGTLGGRAFRWTEKTGFTDAGDLPASGWTQAAAINDAGVIAGSATTEDHIYDDPDGVVVWSPAGARQDVILCSTISCTGEAKAMNQAGVVVGYFDNKAFRWSADGGLTYLGGISVLGGSRANGINDLGQIVGEGSPAGGNGAYFALLWANTDSAISLGTLPGYQGSYAQAINNAGQIVGYAF